MIRRLLLVVFLFFCLKPFPLHAAVFRMALLIANNEGNPGRPSLRFAEQDARNLHKTLTEIGGFPEEQVLLLLGKKSDTIWEGLKRLKTQAIHLVRNPQDQLLFLFYFSGHSENGFLETGASSIELREFQQEIRRLPSSVRISILDTCQSGRMIRSKGGSLLPSFLGDLPPQDLPRGEAILTSSTDLEESHETSEFSGSFFTHYLVSALRGAADFNHDGRVSLTETYSYTSEKTSQKASFHKRTQHPLFHFNLSGEGEVILSNIESGMPLLSLAPAEEGRFLIYEGKTGLLIAEIDKRSGEPRFIALPEGNVIVRLQKRGLFFENQLVAHKGGVYQFQQEAGRPLVTSPIKRILSTERTGRAQKPALLREGELVPLRLLETISTETSHPGDKIRLETAQDIYVDSRRVIAQGAPATGEILAVREKRGLVHGELVCRMGYVQAVDGQWIPLESIVSRSSSGMRTVSDDKNPLSPAGSEKETDVATGITAFFFMPLYPFLKGRDLVLPEGTPFEAYVTRNVTIR